MYKINVIFIYKIWKILLIANRWLYTLQIYVVYNIFVYYNNWFKIPNH